MRRALALTALAALGLWVPAAMADDAPAVKADTAAPAAASDDAGPAASTQEQIDKMDQGADSLDVSQYPQEQQDNYLVFASKCSKCHTLARPINSPYALPEEWAAYVEKMSKKKGSGLGGDDDEHKNIRDKIVSFLSYDSSARKKDVLDQKSKAKGPVRSDAAAPDQKSDAKQGGDKSDSGSKDKGSTDDASSKEPK